MSMLYQLRQIKIRKDGNWAWFICFCALVNNGIVLGIDYSFGVIIESLNGILDSNDSTVSWIPSIHDTSMFLFAWISTIMTQKYGFQAVILGGSIISSVGYLAAAFAVLNKSLIVLVLTHGVIGGAGSGILFAPGNTLASYYFEKHRNVSIGIAMCGGGIGIACFEPLVNYINIQFGAHSVFLAFSLISLLSLLLGIITFPTADNEENNNDDTIDLHDKPSKKEVEDCEETSLLKTSNVKIGEDRVTPGEASISIDSSNVFSTLETHGQSTNVNELTVDKESLKPRCFFDKFKLLTDLRILLYCLVHVMWDLAYYIPIVYLPEMMVIDHGFPRSVNGNIIAVLGVSNVIGKLFSGFIAKPLKNHAILLSTLAMVGLGSGVVGLAFCSAYGEFIAVTLLCGFCIGTFAYNSVNILIEMYGVTDKFQDAYGLMMLAKMLTPIWGPPIGGTLHDFFGAYNVTFYAAGIFIYTAATLSFMVFLINFKRAYSS